MMFGLDRTMRVAVISYVAVLAFVVQVFQASIIKKRDLMHREELETCNFTKISGHPVRLVGGATPFLGRVEVLYNNTWGTVCDDNITHLACRVICRQLDYRGGTCMSVDASLGCRAPAFENVNNTEVPVWLDNLTCTGFETTIDQCPRNNWGDTNCGHKEDAGCICEPPQSGNAGECNRSRHRILPFDEDLPGVGFVEVEDESGIWQLVCDDAWDDIDATVFCNCLGYRGQDSYRAMYNTRHHVPPDRSVLFDAVHCTESDVEKMSNLFDCRVQLSSGRCDPTTEAAAVACQPLPIVNNTYQPKAEVQCNNHLMTVCIQSADDTDDTTPDSLSTGDPSYPAALRVEPWLIEPPCHAINQTTEDDNICYVINMEKCTAAESDPWDNSHVHYCYDLRQIELDNSVGSGQLVMDTNSFRACCLVKRHATIAASFQVERFPLPSVHRSSPVNYTMACFRNSSFTGDPLHLPVEIMQGSMVYCQIRVNVWQEMLYLVVPHCRFLSSKSSSADSVEFLKDKCLTIERLKAQFFSFDSHSWGFSFRMPKFESSNEIYLHCDAYLCDARPSSKEQCDRSCTARSRSRKERSPGKRRHEVGSLEKFPAVYGPFVVKESNCGSYAVHGRLEVVSDHNDCEIFEEMPPNRPLIGKIDIDESPDIDDSQDINAYPAWPHGIHGKMPFAGQMYRDASTASSCHWSLEDAVLNAVVILVIIIVPEWSLLCFLEANFA